MTLSFRLDENDVMVKDVISFTNLYDQLIEKHYNYAVPANNAAELQEKFKEKNTRLSTDPDLRLLQAYGAKLHNGPDGSAVVFLQDNHIMHESDYCYNHRVKARDYIITENGSRLQCRNEYTRKNSPVTQDLHIRAEYDPESGQARAQTALIRLEGSDSYRITSIFRENYTLRIQNYEFRNEDPSIPKDDWFISKPVDTAEYLHYAYLKNGEAFMGVSALCGKLSPLEFSLWKECRDALVAQERARNMKLPRLPAPMTRMIDTLRNLF